ncbi:MAG: M23 family metallopeptidase [Firmicutes bacterium]|nr:M23 family metallopeptidase [Bacillota bacterium]
MGKKKLLKWLPELPRSFTLMLVPHSEKSIHKLRIPKIVIKVSCILGVGLVILVTFFSTRYLQMQDQLVELKDLRKINNVQADKLKNLESKTKQLDAKMSELRFLEKDVREMLDRGEISSRSSSSSNRGNNIQTSGFRPADESRFPVISFLDSTSYEERKDQWDENYQQTASINDVLLAETDTVKEHLEKLKEDVAIRKAYLEAKPYGLPNSGRITSYYGNRRHPLSGRRDFHTGIDIAAPYGNLVVATGKGTVIFTGYKAGYGRTVIIDHPFGFRTIYAHNSSLKVKVGETVTRGDGIALVGSSGTSTGPHVHYEVFANGTRVNPSDYIR